MKQPPLWKIAILIWLAIYPTITLFFGIFGEYLAAIEPLPLRTMLTTIVIVPLMVFVIVPFLQQILKKWLIQ
jgi:antibiotic biosynthesis monooxygenase (ABM) superfamily enzyme